LHLRAICYQHVPICTAEEMMRPANYANLVREFSSNHKVAPPSHVIQRAIVRDPTAGIRYVDQHLTVCCCRLWVPAGGQDKIPRSILRYLLPPQISALATWQGLATKGEWLDDSDIPFFLLVSQNLDSLSLSRSLSLFL
jgi:hypothetical protein